MHSVLNMIHVSGAVLWGGAALYAAFFLAPAAKAAGDAAGPFMGALVRGRLAATMTAASLITVGSGLWLWIRRFGDSMPTGFSGVAISIGALAGIVALVIALFRVLPTVRAIRALVTEISSGDGPPSADQLGRMGMLRGRMVSAGNLLAGVVVVAVIGMGLGG
ncbi:MAG TPA: hypothetical protein VIY70_07425 [Acidimicrobiia bacterium]